MSDNVCMDKTEISERYLDDLIVEVANFMLVKKPQDFLDDRKANIVVRDTTILHTIRTRLPIGSIPIGDLYVFTPEDGFRYYRNDDGIDKDPKYHTKYVKEIRCGAKLSEVVNHLYNLASDNKVFGHDHNSMQTSVNVLFFDELSRRRLEEQFKSTRGRFKLISTLDLNVENYGVIKLYTCSTTQNN